MGEVYAAEDTRLGRKVALKILPGAMAADPERRNRFESEARAVAALNHPNIVTLYSVEEADGIFFLTMELVHGKTLAEIVSSQGLPLQHFFELALPLADAVAAAHAQGVTHRDLKPENIMVAGDRRLKILDFGLAKLRETARPIGAGSSLPTQSVTGEGRIVGTVAYMSPEQAEGKEVDHRSDIFSLGILLYQMVTGQRPFKGETVFSVISSILRDMPPSVTQVKAGLPRDLARIIQRCLAKDPTRRFQTALDLRNELEELKAELDSGEGSPAEVALRRSGRWNWLLAVVGLVAGGILVALLLRRQIGPERPATPEPVTGEFTQLTHDPGPENWPSLSPDGKSIIYSSRASGNWNIYWLRVGGQNPVNLTPDSPLDDIEPAFLPDGEMIAFRSDREGGGIFVMGATGESVRRLTNFGASPAWFPDGKSIAFGTEPVTDSQNRGTTSQLWRVELATGEKRKIFGGGRCGAIGFPARPAHRLLGRVGGTA